MQVSAEIRWFWPRGSEDAAIGVWFLEAIRQKSSPGGTSAPEERTDAYLKSSVELGLKMRGGEGPVEIKGLVGHGDLGLDVSPFTGPVEIWSKWSTNAFQITGYQTIQTEKCRWLRKYDTKLTVPTEVDTNELQQGCNVEFTRICAAGEQWESFSFESFGPLSTVESSLRRTAELVAANCPALPAGAELLSYPAWLAAKVK